jgi:hypothetical protein
MGIPWNSICICDKTNGAAGPEWLNELHLAYDKTIELLDELKESKHDYKVLDCLVLKGDLKDPVWCGLGETGGVVAMNPHTPVRKARAIAHEMGHGFHELWRDDDHQCCGQAMAEAIRWFVEKRLCSLGWKPRKDWTSVLDACGRDWKKFKM